MIKPVQTIMVSRLHAVDWQDFGYASSMKELTAQVGRSLTKIGRLTKRQSLTAISLPKEHLYSYRAELGRDLGCETWTDGYLEVGFWSFSVKHSRYTEQTVPCLNWRPNIDHTRTAPSLDGYPGYFIQATPRLIQTRTFSLKLIFTICAATQTMCRYLPFVLLLGGELELHYPARPHIRESSPIFRANLQSGPKTRVDQGKISWSPVPAGMDSNLDFNIRQKRPRYRLQIHTDVY